MEFVCVVCYCLFCIIQIESNGEIWSSEFKIHETERFFGRWYNYGYNDFEENEEYFNDLKTICGYYGVDEEEIEYLRSLGYSYDEIEEMILYDIDIFEESEVEICVQRARSSLQKTARHGTNILCWRILRQALS